MLDCTRRRERSCGPQHMCDSRVGSSGFMLCGAEECVDVCASGR